MRLAFFFSLRLPLNGLTLKAFRRSGSQIWLSIRSSPSSSSSSSSSFMVPGEWSSIASAFDDRSNVIGLCSTMHSIITLLLLVHRGIRVLPLGRWRKRLATLEDWRRLLPWQPLNWNCGPSLGLMGCSKKSLSTLKLLRPIWPLQSCLRHVNHNPQFSSISINTTFFFWHINALSFLDCADILPWQVELTLLVDNSEENEASYATNTKIQWAQIHLWNDPLTFID